MLYIFYLVLLVLLLLCFSQLSIRRAGSILKFPNAILNILLLYIILGAATFNNDWLAYEELFEGLKPTYDLLYLFSYKLFGFLNLSYETFYSVNQLIIYVAIVYFINKFVPKFTFFVVLAMLVIAAPNLSILLRYYTAFAFFLIAAYCFKIKNNLFWGVIWMGISCISHFGIVILFILLYLIKYLKIEKSLKIVFLLAILLWVAKSIVFVLLNLIGIASFGVYIADQSSFIGGLFAALPYIPWLIAICWRHVFLLKKVPGVKDDEKYLFLFKLSIFPILFFILALSIQIILHRYVEPFIIVWCCYLCYTIRFSKKWNKLFILIGIIFMILISFYTKYFLPLRLLGASEWLIHYLEILNSNKFEIFKINDF